MVSKFVPVYDDLSDHSGTLMLDFCTDIGRSFDGVLTSHGLGDAKDLDYGEKLTGFDLAKAMFCGLNPAPTNPDLKRIVRIKNLLSKVQSEYLALSEGGRINLTIWATGTPERISDNRIVFVGKDAPDRTSLAVSPEWQKLRDVFTPFLMTMRQNYEDDFHQALTEQLDGQNRAIKAETCALMPSLQFHLEAPCPHSDHTVGAHETTRDVDETEITSKKDENYTAHFSDDGTRSPNPSKAAKLAIAENATKQQGPLPATIKAARRLGVI